MTNDADRLDRRRILLHGLEPASVGRKIRVLIAEDHAMVRQSLSLLLHTHGDIDVVGTAANGRDAAELAEKLAPDVVLMDLAMPGMNGIEATRQIHRRVPQTRVLLVTAHADHAQIIEAVRAGVLGCVVKQADQAELVLAIQAVSKGNPFFSEALSNGRSAMDFIMEAHGATTAIDDPLTTREREVLQLIAEGHQNQTIADELFISVKTVEAHKANIKKKLRATSDVDLWRYAVRRGIIGLDEQPQAHV
ncbi:MAG TPA: response regulator transcription factor [Dehalococcoidia bacterium]|jgi:two-component system response regulator NreC|nr:response regulator transcription factor [Dehalococcoidia bacterium]